MRARILYVLSGCLGLAAWTSDVQAGFLLEGRKTAGDTTSAIQTGPDGPAAAKSLNAYGLGLVVLGPVPEESPGRARAHVGLPAGKHQRCRHLQLLRGSRGNPHPAGGPGGPQHPLPGGLPDTSRSGGTPGSKAATRKASSWRLGPASAAPRPRSSTRSKVSRPGPPPDTRTAPPIPKSEPAGPPGSASAGPWATGA